MKTSRSGYLQRCLIKHLEGLTVAYDLTVRDSDKSVIQFNYGDDGMEVTKTQFLRRKQMNFLADNCKAIIDKKTIRQFKSMEDYEKLEEHTKKVIFVYKYARSFYFLFVYLKFDIVSRTNMRKGKNSSHFFPFFLNGNEFFLTEIRATKLLVN